MLTDEKNRLEKKQEGLPLEEVELRSISFFLNHDLIYYRDKEDERDRLCIFKT